MLPMIVRLISCVATSNVEHNDNSKIPDFASTSSFERSGYFGDLKTPEFCLR